MKYLIPFIAVAVIPLGVAAPAAAHPMPHPAKELYFAHRCAKGDVRACIHRATLHWGGSVAVGYYIAHRESRLHCGATNATSGAAGLFQFMPRTWTYTPYRHYSPYSCKRAALGWAWLYYHKHQPWHWRA